MSCAYDNNSKDSKINLVYPKKKRGRPFKLENENIDNIDLAKTPLINLSNDNTIYLTDMDNSSNQEKIFNNTANYIPPVMNKLQQNIYKRRYSKTLMDDEGDSLNQFQNNLKQQALNSDDSKSDTLNQIINIQKQNPGQISSKFADLSIFLQKNLNKQKLLKELSVLKKNLNNMESLIDGSINQEVMALNELESKFDRFNPREFDTLDHGEDDNNYHIYNNIAKMSFYDGYEQVSVFNARLNFTAPLSAYVVLKKDSFGKVLNLMVENTLNDYARSLDNKKSHQKYDALRVQDSNSVPSLINTVNNSKRKLQTEDSENKKIKLEAKNNNDEADEEEANAIFNNKFLENEGLDEMKTIIHQGKPIISNKETLNQKFSTSNMRSAIKPQQKIKSTEQEFLGVNAKAQVSKNPADDIAFWTSLNKVLENIDNSDSSSKPSNQIIKDINYKNRVPESLFGMQPSLEHEVILQIQDILPPGKIIGILCKNYFKSPIHGLYPIINEDWWMDTMHRLLGFSESQLNSDQQPKVNISRRFDISKLATLLVMMRLTYLTYPDSLKDCTTDEERYVLSYPIGKEFIDLAQRSLNVFKMLRKGILPVLHCFLLLRVYRKYAPEEGDMVDACDSETFTGFLVKISTSIGLNTDVARSAWVKDEGMYVDQWRKCWYSVYFFDFMENCNMGNSSSIDIDSFDTKLPEFKLNPANGTYPSFITDAPLEDTVVNNFQRNFETSLIARDLLNCITNKRLKFSVPNLQIILNNLNGSIEKNFGSSMADIIDLEVEILADSVFKLNNFIWFIELKVLLFLSYMHIFIHIDEQISSNYDLIIKNDELSEKVQLYHYYLKKLLEIYVEIEPVLLLCYNSSKIDPIFGRGSKMIVLEVCQNLIIRLVPGIQIITARFLHFKFNFKDILNKKDDPETKIVNDIVNNLMEKLSHTGGICRLLAKKHFQMWRNSQSSQFIFYLLNQPFEENLFKKDSNINNLHRNEWQYHNGNSYDRTYPHKFLPQSNFLTNYNKEHLLEIYSTLNHVKWNIFGDHYTEDEIKQGILYRDKQYETSFNKFLKKNASSQFGKKNKKKAANQKLRGKAAAKNKTANEDANVTPLDEAYSKSDLLNDTPDSGKISRNSISDDNLDFIDEIDKYWYQNYTSGNKGLFMEDNHQDQMLNYSNLDDFFDKSMPQTTGEFSLYPIGDHMINTEENKNVNGATPDTEALRNQVIEKLAALIPDENSSSKTINQQTTNVSTASETLKKFMFNNGSNNHSDEVNF
ncbi:uncharacterized protein HGUI_01217 [Hanseniaspora guilliermondii]|uniref:Xylanolytic transcriptional activator regulatory domain-containing protein n=1 Tax=Hanseniaspora guilliermondii TaxID=56406 RepID=A0A1L0CKU4_9ASCO|nr:uncharacterized protein HGUI_01217 [Hanseniaspora guilliermondii]